MIDEVKDPAPTLAEPEVNAQSDAPEESMCEQRSNSRPGSLGSGKRKPSFSSRYALPEKMPNIALSNAQNMVSCIFFFLAYMIFLALFKNEYIYTYICYVIHIVLDRIKSNQIISSAFIEKIETCTSRTSLVMIHRSFVKTCIFVIYFSEYRNPVIFLNFI